VARKPTTVLGWIRVLLNHIFPGMPEDEVVAILKLRSLPPVRNPYESVLTEGDNADLLKDALDEGDVAAAFVDVKRQGKKGKRGPPGPIHTEDDVTLLELLLLDDVPPPSAAAAGSKAHVPCPPNITPEWAKTLIPQVVGCWITHKNDDVSHFRWQAGYAREQMPRSASLAYGEGSEITEWDSLKHAIKFVWDCHYELYAVVCPYDFG
jgi:hypothetical protein